VAALQVASRANRQLDRMISTHILPSDTRDRVRHILHQLAKFPMLGKALGPPWTGHRFVLGPWRWMLILYTYDDGEDLILVTTFQDARRAIAATATR
jgi:hypothetical protein